MAERRPTGKVAVVTGAGHGIGRFEALELAGQGASIVVADYGTRADGAKLAEVVADEIRAAGGRAVASTQDLSRSEGARNTIQHAVDAFGGLDILVNNAGMRGGNPINQLTDEQWDLVVNSHLKATFLTIKHAVPYLRARGGGSIVNTGSEAGLGMPFNSAYSAAKEGIAGLTRSVAREQGRFNIRTNMIRPRATGGAVGGGDWFQKNLAGTWKPLLDRLGRFWIGERGTAGWDTSSSPASIAAFVAWLCSPAAAHVNGQDFFVGGGEVALLTQPAFGTAFFREGDWTLDALDALGPSLTGHLVDHFKVENPFIDPDL